MLPSSAVEAGTGIASGRNHLAAPLSNAWLKSLTSTRIVDDKKRQTRDREPTAANMALLCAALLLVCNILAVSFRRVPLSAAVTC